MNRFKTQRDAKEFLVGEIAHEADRQGRPLTDIERKMLYFSESDWTLPDMDEVAEQFDRDYDSGKYEHRIAGLAKAAHVRVGEDRSAWSEAVKRLSKGDHYLLVMVGQGGNRRPGELTWRGVVAVVSIFVGLLALGIMWPESCRHHGPDRDRALGLYVWASAVAIVVAYSVARLIVGGQRVDDWFWNVAERSWRVAQRVVGAKGDE